MHDLTVGSIPRHLARMALPIALGMFFQTMYVLVDLYFVSHLGDAAIAGVGAAGNISFLILALTQVLAIGTTTLIAQAAGRKDRDDANLIYNQSLLLATLCGLGTLVIGYAVAGFYASTLGADAATAQAAHTYLLWFLPGMALQFAVVAMGAALRGTGLAMPGMIVQIAAVLINAILAPVLIAGWGTGHPLGVAGAGLATSLSMAVGVVLMVVYFLRLETFVGFQPVLVKPHPPACRRILAIGLPAGGEFALMFVLVVTIYFIIRDFGASAQAGYGIGSRVMQAVFLPAMAIAFAVSPIAGQNMGAGLHDRVRATFRHAALASCAVMVVLTLLCQWHPEALVRPFGNGRDPQALLVATDLLRIIAWNFVASGLIFTCSGTFQALGNTVPSLLSSGSRLFTFAIPGLLLSHRPGFRLEDLWHLSVATVSLQALTSLWLLRGQFRSRLSMPIAVGVS